jgi:hypothetical protein
MTDLSWKPKLNALAAVTNTMNWYKSYSEVPEKISEMTSKQIITYLES